MSEDFAVLLAEMQAGFIDELPDRCRRLEDGVMALEKKEPGAFDELYRQVHSLKGSGGMFGIAVITTICHQFESFISEAHDHFERKAATTALAYVDLLRKTFEPAGRNTAGVTEIEQALERMRVDSLSGRLSVLVVEPSDTSRRLYKDVFSAPSIQLVLLEGGMAALERMLHTPFDLLVISRELPDLNAIAVVAAIRESRRRNSDIPVIIVSSNPAPVPKHLRINGVVRRDPQLRSILAGLLAEALAAQRSNPSATK